MKRIVDEHGFVWNDIPKANIPIIPKKKNEKIVIYEVLGTRQDPGNKGQLIIPSSRNVPPLDRVKLSKDGTDYYDLALVTSQGRGGSLNLNHDIWFRKETAGRITLNLSHGRDQEIYRFFELSNFNASNPNRDPSKMVIFKRLDPVKEAEERKVTRDNIHAAISAAKALSDDKASLLFESLGYGKPVSMPVVRDKVESYAEQHPNDFHNLISSDLTQPKADIKSALQEGIIKQVMNKRSFAWSANNEVIFQYPQRDGADELFAEFLVTNGRGQAIHEDMKRLLGSDKVSE